MVSLVNRTLPPPCADLVGLLDRCTPPETIAKSIALAAQERSMDPTAKAPVLMVDMDIYSIIKVYAIICIYVELYMNKDIEDRRTATVRCYVHFLRM